MHKKGLKDVDVKQKKVLVRVDFNVPLSPDGDVLDDFRIKAVIPTINYLRENNAKVILMSHLGRPKGKPVKKFRMDPVAKELSSLLGVPVKKLDDCIGEEVEKAIADADYGDVILLENLRFHREEIENDTEFAKKLSSLADIFVNDAFATAHRVAASNVGITAFLPSVAGFLMEKEIVVLSKLISAPEHPFVAILGGLCEEDTISTARQILENAKKNDVKITLPADVLSVPEVKENAPARIVDIEEIPNDGIGVDIGPKTAKIFKKMIQNAKTIVWNGPLGVFEIEAFAKGTYEIGKFLGTLKDKTIVAGGGETAATLRKFGVDKQITHVSTGGGAFLKFLEGDSLPAIEVIEDQN
jgi:3-phosphoglycerate kinase